jgi:hypothetical protein
MKTFKQFTEDIKIPIKVGDTVLGGKWKNKKIVVKSITKNDKGDWQINGKPLLKFRIIQEDTIDVKTGNDNLKVWLRIDSNKEGEWWEVVVFKNDKVIKRDKFDSEKEARKKFNQVYKEF